MDHLLPLFVWLDGLADVDPITRAIWIDAGVIIGTLPTLGTHVESLLEQRDRINLELDQLVRQGAAALERIA